MSLSTLLVRAERLQQDDALDLVFEEIDDALHAGHPGPWPQVDDLFASADTNKLRWTTIIGMLCITNGSFHTQIPERRRFFDRCVERAKRTRRNAKRLLGGFGYEVGDE